MANWHGYIGIENLALNAGQKATLRQALRALGPGGGRRPEHQNHWRLRNDNDAAIYEANFNEDHLTIDTFKDRLAAIFSVSAATIDHATQATPYGPMVTFSRTGTDYIRFLAFGGVSADWQTSRQAAAAYLAANAADWEPGE